VLLAPHVFVEQITVDAIQHARKAYVAVALRDHMAHDHDAVDVAFWGWCDVWLNPAFAAWNLEAEAARASPPRSLLIQGVDAPYGTLKQLDRIEARLPRAERLVVPGGHSPPLEHAPEVGAATRTLPQNV
jgi:pimeloyl-ACP methyl ester carboxylesterase